jgi:hypothetical protein
MPTTSAPSAAALLRGLVCRDGRAGYASRVTTSPPENFGPFTRDAEFERRDRELLTMWEPAAATAIDDFFASRPEEIIALPTGQAPVVANS